MSPVLIRRAAFPLALLGAVAFDSGCSPTAPAVNRRGRLTVVASFYPLAEAVRQVGGSRVDVTDLTPPGSEPHDLELTPDQVSRVADAGLVVYMGRGFQPAVEKVARARGSKSPTLAVLDAVRTPGADGDPHVWLDPVLWESVVDKIAAALGRAKPAAAEHFRAGAAAYRAQIAEVDTRYRVGLADCRRRVIVTSHRAFGRLAARYGLEQQGVAGLAPDAEPDPRHLAELADLVRRRGVTTIFTETLASPRVARALAREAGVTTAVLDPIEGISTDRVAAGVSYTSVMVDNLIALRSALDCVSP